MPNDSTTRSASPGQQGISERLRVFVEGFRSQREPILEFVSALAVDTRPGASVLDVGAGDAPYRELFAHARYATNDWSESPHRGARDVDVIGSADALPVADSTYDVVLCTEVLEHVPDPAAVVRECCRILVPGGRVAITVPFLWKLHELPHDYFRFTEAGLRHLMTTAGFTKVEIRPRGDGFAAIAQLIRNLGWAMGEADDGLNDARIQAREALGELSDALLRLSPLDVKRVTPLGYSGLGYKAAQSVRA